MRRHRPQLFRALGKSDPPAQIEIGQRKLLHQSTVKHDSWAATAIYAGDGQKVVCKFNRTQPIFFFPMKWLGRFLARRENEMYRRLSDLPNIARGYDRVWVDGELVPHAAAHDFIEGHPLRWHDKISDTFFEKLSKTIAELHRRDIAYVDLNKSENVIMDQNGDPYLIDFQISYQPPSGFPFGLWPASWLGRWVLKILQRCDNYHLAKMNFRFRPDQMEGAENRKARQRPWWIRAHRKFAVPFRKMRRRLLVLAKIRGGKGKAHSEAFVEEGLRATVQDIKPILALHQLLLSAEYVNRYGPTDESYSSQICEDLFGAASNPADLKELMKTKKRISRHDQVVDVLRGRKFFLLSDQWDDEWITSKIREIASPLEASNNQNSSANKAA